MSRRGRCIHDKDGQHGMFGLSPEELPVAGIGYLHGKNYRTALSVDDAVLKASRDYSQTGRFPECSGHQGDKTTR
jgi:hypothetical protein